LAVISRLRWPQSFDLRLTRHQIDHPGSTPGSERSLGEWPSLQEAQPIDCVLAPVAFVDPLKRTVTMRLPPNLRGPNRGGSQKIIQSDISLGARLRLRRI